LFNEPSYGHVAFLLVRLGRNQSGSARAERRTPGIADFYDFAGSQFDGAPIQFLECQGNVVSICGKKSS
jgi:hypothetical protein